MMRRVLLVLLGVLVLAALPSPAEASGRSGHHGRGGHSYSGGHSDRGGHSYRGGYSYRGGHAYYGGHGYRHAGHYAFWLAPFGWGPGWYGAYAYPYRYPYRPPTRLVVEERVVYVERPPSAAPAENWWYYCESAADYYPDVASCPESWVKVAPRPDSSRSPQ